MTLCYPGDITSAHPDDLRYLPYVTRINLIWSLSHPDDVSIGSISSGWLMDTSGCHRDDLRYWFRSSGWHNVIWILSHQYELPIIYHPDDLWPIHFGWAYGKFIMSSWWHTPPLLSHLNDISFLWLNWGWYLIRVSYGEFIIIMFVIQIR